MRATGGTVFVPRGVYKLTESIALDANGVRLVGEGAFATNLTFYVSEGPCLILGQLGTDANVGWAELRDLAVHQSVARTSGPLILVWGTNEATIQNVIVDGGVTLGWDGIHIDGPQNYNTHLTNVWINAFQNAALALGGDNEAANIWVSDCEFAASAYGIYVSDLSGLTINNSEMLNDEHGFVANPPEGKSAQAIILNGCGIDTTRGEGNGISLYGGGQTNHVTVSDSWIASNNHGINVGRVKAMVVSGNHIVNNRGHGIYIQGGKDIAITGNAILSNGTAAAYKEPTYHGVALDGAVRGVTVNGNSIGWGGVSEDSDELGIAGWCSKQAYGVWIGRSVTGVIVTSNIFRDNRLGAVFNIGTGPIVIANNLEITDSTLNNPLHIPGCSNP